MYLEGRCIGTDIFKERSNKGAYKSSSGNVSDQ
jgi:hypothetical protein